MSGTDKETDMKICENGVIRDMTPEEIAQMIPDMNYQYLQK